MRLTEHLDTLFDKYYGSVRSYIKWYTDDPGLEIEIVTETFVKFFSVSYADPKLPAVRLLEIARGVAIGVIKDIRPTAEEIQRRVLLFAFLDPISNQDRDIYLERFYRNASDEELSIKFGISVYAVQQKIRRIAIVHGRNLKPPTQENNIRNQ